MIEGRIPLPGPRFYILPHPQAPIFSLENPKNAQKIIVQLVQEVRSGNFPDTAKFVGLIRQVGFVSLWFFLKVILGFAGPYDELDDNLHREMCNFRQSEYCMSPGARAAILLTRGFLKTTINTHGADHWELTRDQDLSIAMANATATKPAIWRGIIKVSVERNPLYRACYPECIPRGDAKRWNDSELVFPGRTRHRGEPSIYALGVGASGEGYHFDLFNPDDLVGLDDLDVEHAGNLNMMQKVQWFKTNRRALLRSQKKSRIIFPMTRFSLDDPSELILGDCRKIFGYGLEEFEEKPGGTWVVYNRLGIEDGKEVCPQVLTATDLSKQMDDDPWGAMTQSMNRPAKTGMVEFSDYKVKPASLDWNDAEQRWYLLLDGDINFDELDEPPKPKPLSSYDIVMAIDPASTEKDITAKTSKTAIVIWAVDRKNAILLWRRNGYYAADVWFGYIFDGARKFGGIVRECIVESAAMQAVLAPLLRKEARLQNSPLYFNPQPAHGDKVVRIRMCFQPKLARGEIYAVVGEDVELKSEVKVFPASKWRMDVLDASEKAITGAIPPPSEEEEEEARRASEGTDQCVSSLTGY